MLCAFLVFVQGTIKDQLKSKGRGDDKVGVTHGRDGQYLLRVKEMMGGS